VVEFRLSPADHARISAAVAEAEANTDGEIVTIMAPASDRYADVPLHWALLAMLLALALLAIRPGAIDWTLDRFTGGWGEAPSEHLRLTAVLVMLSVVFLVVRLVVGLSAIRMALTPGATKARRVRRRAIDLFRVAAEQRTCAATAVLLYVSLAEHRAELIGDAAINAKVAPDLWGGAMAALIGAVKDGRPGDGMVEAVTRVGTVLHGHFPRSADDRNELPDRLIEL
jgi:putative membrane protein